MANLMRKVIKQGHNTLTITLPSDWVKKLDVRPGMMVEISEKDNDLVISKEKKQEIKQIEFDITGMDLPTIWKHFVGVYRAGYDEVVVKFTPGEIMHSPHKYLSKHKFPSKHMPIGEPASASVIQGFVKRFIGFEVIEQGKDFVRIKEMSKLTSREFDNGLKKLFSITQEMAEEALRAIKKKNMKIASELQEKDIVFYKFHDYCVRILNKTGNKDPRRTSLLYATMFFLKIITNNLKHIAHHLISRTEKYEVGGKILKLAEIIKQRIDGFEELFYNFKKEELNTHAETDKIIYPDLDKFYENTTGREKEIIHHLRTIDDNISALRMVRVEMEF